jgi:hypothetical protein
MSNEWFEIAYINDDEAVLHGQIVENGEERRVRVLLSIDQRCAIEALQAKHDRELASLVREYAALSA